MHARPLVGMSLVPVLAIAATATTGAAAPPEQPGDHVLTETVIYKNERAPEILLGVNTPIEAVQRSGLDPSMFSLHFSAAEPAYTPEVGEAITVVYTDATSTYATTRSGCTQTATAGRPYVNFDRATVSVSFSRSAGCSGNVPVTGTLQWLGMLNAWWARGQNTFASLRPGNGYSATFKADNACGAGAGTWRSTAFFGPTGVSPSTSANTSLTCRG